MSTSKFRLALLQLAVTANKTENLQRASKLIREAASAGAKVLCLPECFNFPYEPKSFSEYAETIPGRSSEMLSRCAQENGVYLVGGTLSEKENGKLYNTCLVYGPDGSMLAKHRKVHLGGFNIPGKLVFSESDFLTAGNGLTTFDTPFCKVGVGVCYDIAFPSFSQLYAQLGCKLLLYPGAFNLVTGPQYWKLLPKCRALENQVYFAWVSPARNQAASCVIWGHSILADPSGAVVCSAGAGEELLLAEVDLDHLATVRSQMPIEEHMRNDLYKVVVCTDGEAKSL
ncbi:omega-amidase NIT2 [Ixodes scapularis]|uniref:omega-amidase NIT2 n=1 Tax=Ixodes scapularis TaxID=6945 RepID=UPI001A9F1B60|nr:omega-amidase NIT2 [Ixodes scapularis]